MALEVSMRFDPDAPGILKFAATPAEIATAPEYQCQITSVALTPSPVTETLDATLCRAESDSAKPSKWALDLEFLQDWTAVPDDSLSWFLYDNDGKEVAFSVSLTAAAPPVATGTCSISAGAFLGPASGVLTATASLPCKGKPEFTRPTGVAAAAFTADEAAAAAEAAGGGGDAATPASTDDPDAVPVPAA